MRRFLEGKVGRCEKKYRLGLGRDLHKHLEKLKRCSCDRSLRGMFARKLRGRTVCGCATVG